MPLQLFLNELSVPNERLAREVSVGHLKRLVATVREARRLDASSILNSEESLVNFPLCKEVTIASIRNDGECVEESLYLKTVNSRAPLRLAAADAEDRDPSLSEYKMRPDAPVRADEISLGLGHAHLFDGLGLSLGSHYFWDEPSIALSLAKLDSDGEVINELVAARNANSPAAVAHHAEALRALLAPAIADGAELWERRVELLPNLVFIPRTRSQLEGILIGDPMLQQAWIKLSGIDRAIEGWKIIKGPYPMFPFNVRPESKTRRGLAEFEDVEGRKRIFSDHCDLAPTEGRIHFIVESCPRRHALIGHVGRKLGIG